MKRRKIEREFGVPIAGEILEKALWTQTALKRLPAAGPLDFATLFGRRAPVVIDLGCGNGRFLIQSSVWRPDHDHLGLDVLPLVLRYATRRANQRGLGNVRFACLDAESFVARYLGLASVREIHCYHPQPYHDPRQVRRRLIRPRFLGQICRVLDPDGKFFVQTDNEPYWEYLSDVIPQFFEWHEESRPWADAPRGRTRREIIALRRGLRVFRGWGRPRRDLTAAGVQSLVERLPLPLFDAGPRNRQLDELECE